MSPQASPQPQLSSRQVSAAAENLAAAQFSLYGFDVLEQASRARFVYDLGVAKSGGMMKVTVHGSLDGFWDLVEAYLEQTSSGNADYHRAIDRWLENHGWRVSAPGSPRTASTGARASSDGSRPSPKRRSTSPTVDSGSARASAIRGPLFRCCRSRAICRSTRSGSWRGERRGREVRSRSPLTPSRR